MTVDTDPEIIRKIVDQVNAYTDSQIIGFPGGFNSEWDDNFVRLQWNGDANLAAAAAEIAFNLAAGSVDVWHKIMADFRNSEAEGLGIEAALAGMIFGGLTLGYQIGVNRLDKVDA